VIPIELKVDNPQWAVVYSIPTGIVQWKNGGTCLSNYSIHFSWERSCKVDK